MLNFIKEDKHLVLSYTGELRESSWIYAVLAAEGATTLKRTFTLGTNELVSNEDPDDPEAPVLFNIGTAHGEYYRLSKDVFGLQDDIFIHKDTRLTQQFFVAERNISILARLDRLSNGTIHIGGSDEEAIPEGAFAELVQKFPNTYELNRYASARVGAVISSYIATKEDYEAKYQRYMNRKSSIKGADTYRLVADAEIEKYSLLLSKMTHMLQAEESYSEAQWQQEILQIILLLYPKYIYVFKEAPVRDTYNEKNGNIDFLLVDSTGNTDIIEIKKPFDKSIVTERTYRDNHIPLRELSGTVMQIEKYIFYLNKWGRKGEEKLTSHYEEQLEPGFKLKITNPGAIIILGRDKGLTQDQQHDYEVIKRKYKNVIDILTYDDLLSRLNAALRHWKEEV